MSQTNTVASRTLTPPELDPEKGMVSTSKLDGNDNTEDNVTGLTTAKDRAQISSLSAMCILNVGVLGDVIKRGSYYGSMYVPLLVMVTVALFMQIIAGILSLQISNMKKYYNEFGGSSRKLWQCFRKCFPCLSKKDPLEGGGPNESQKFPTEARSRRTTPPSQIEEASTTGGTAPDNIERSDIYDSTLSVHGTDGDKGPNNGKSLKAMSLAKLGKSMKKALEAEELNVEMQVKIRFAEKEINRYRAKLDEHEKELQQLRRMEHALLAELEGTKAEIRRLAEARGRTKEAEMSQGFKTPRTG